MAKTETKDALKLMVGKVRFSYANVHTPTSVDNEEPAYSVCLLIPKIDKKMKESVDKVVKLALEEGKKSKWAGKIPPNLKLPLHDGDAEKPDDPNYAGHWFINARNKRKPGILVRNPTTKTNEELINKEDFYSGCYGYATVVFFAFNKKSNGIGASLQNLLKTADGERLAGGATAEEDFESFGSDEEGDDMM